MDDLVEALEEAEEGRFATSTPRSDAALPTTEGRADEAAGGARLSRSEEKGERLRPGRRLPLFWELKLCRLMLEVVMMSASSGLTPHQTFFMSRMI